MPAMTPEQWQRAPAVFDAAIDQPQSARRAFVDSACSADDVDALVRAEVLGMLAADERGATEQDQLARMAPDLLVQIDAEARAGERNALIGTRVGPWVLLRELGHGGMGAVFLADRVEGDFQQQAAIKLIRPGWDAGDLQRRFRSERRILAGLSHPHIARLLDGGETADGKPYLAMEFVDGQPLCAHCDARRLPIEARLRLFLSICAAVAHAHRSLVVHRDLKPSNILVTADGEVKLLDFGIARLLAPGVHATGSALRLFTPEYAAPEQVRGDAVTTSVDVYALGLMLFELVTGRRPYGDAASTPAAYERAILTDEPARPSQVAQSRDALAGPLAHARFLEPDELGSRVRGDLDAIVLKALRKEPAQRYLSVEAFADDVRRHLQHEPVAARRGNWRYRAGRFVRRHRAAAALVTLALGGLLTGLAIALWQADNARVQQQLAQAEAHKARAVAQFLTGVFKSADPTSNDGRDPKASELLDRAVADIDSQTDLDASTRGALLMAMGSAYLSIDQHDRGLDLCRRARQSALLGDDEGLRIETQLALARALDIDGQSTAALTELEEAQRKVDDGLVIEPRLLGRIDYVFAVVLQSLDRSGEALPHLERAYRRAIADAGIGSAAAGLLIEVYSVALVDMQRAGEAIDITRSNYEAAKAHDDMPLVRRANFASAYGYALLKGGRPAEAESVYREALAWDEQLYGVENLSTDIALNNVGVALRAQDRFADAAVFAERVLALRRAHLAPDSAAIARSSAVLGNTYRGAGDVDRAIELIGAGLATFEQRGQADTSSALNARLNLAYALETKGQLEQARDTVAPMLAHTRREGSQYAGAGGTDVLLLHARLQARLESDATDCSESRAALEVAAGSTVQASEAHVLVADCEWRHGRPSPALVHLQTLEASTPLQALSPYAKTRLAELQRSLRPLPDAPLRP